MAFTTTNPVRSIVVHEARAGRAAAPPGQTEQVTPRPMRAELA
jgi:hypothetical protein